MKRKKQSGIDLILFDLGGVLIEHAGMPALIRWTKGRLKKDEIWRYWLLSPVVRKFESGQCTPDEFADAIVEELKLQITPAEFLSEFSGWPKGIYPGADELLRSLKKVRLGTLCNTNEIHWNKYRTFGLLDYFKYHFISHLNGLAKPDLIAFRNVVSLTNIPPERILFLDDNQLNVTGAMAAGMTAYRVNGASCARAKLEEIRMLPDKKC